MTDKQIKLKELVEKYSDLKVKEWVEDCYGDKSKRDGYRKGAERVLRRILKLVEDKQEVDEETLSK